MMNNKVYHYCSTYEVSTVATNILIALTKNDWSEDVALTKIIAILKEENDIFSATLSAARSGDHSRILHDLDEIADRAFVCAKQFLWANTFDLDVQKSVDASFLWNKVFAQHNLNLHRQSYENQMALSKALVEHMEEPELSAKMVGLTGVADAFTAFTSASDNFRKKFNEFKEVEALVEDMVAPSTQKSVVKNVINDKLLTYLNGVVIALPEKYSDILNVINNHIESINTKARARRTLSMNEEEPEVEAE